MKTYLVTYESKSNILKGRLCIPADNLVQCQDKFWNYLQNNAVYNHMWCLSFEIEEIESCS